MNTTSQAVTFLSFRIIYLGTVRHCVPAPGDPPMTLVRSGGVRMLMRDARDGSQHSSSSCPAPLPPPPPLPSFLFPPLIILPLHLITSGCAGSVGELSSPCISHYQSTAGRVSSCSSRLHRDAATVAAGLTSRASHGPALRPVYSLCVAGR